MAEFEAGFVAAMNAQRSVPTPISLAAWHGGLSSAGWYNVGNIPMGVFFAAASNLPRCAAGRVEIRGNGHDFVSVSPEHPCTEAVWAILCGTPDGARTHLPVVECRAMECLTEEDRRLGLAVTHADMQRAFERVMQQVRNIARPNPNRIRDHVANYRALAERFVAQGHTNGTLTGAMAYLMEHVASHLRMNVDEMLTWMASE